jgi:curved DNA-binding protein CbpA
MKTLYDLLEALPRDDAEGLRVAFRRAVKGAHPDLRPGDPDAALKFRQIVHASEILGDPDQRAAYDDLLEVARWEHDSAHAHPIAARINRFASGVIMLAGAAVVTVAGYLLFMHMSAASVAAAHNAVATRALPEIANVNAAPVISAVTSIPGRQIVPSAATPPSGTEGGAIAESDPAQLNATLSPAYIDRGMIFYRARKSSHVLPDAAAANRIEKAGLSKPAPTAARKPPVDRAMVAPSATPLPQRRTAARDPSQNEGFASAMLR